MSEHPSETAGEEGAEEDIFELGEVTQPPLKAHASSIHAYQKSEMDQYLEEIVFPNTDDFNILHWWKVNSGKYPTLARMARDILAVPATTIASEAAFSVGGRVIDESRASLLPDIVEALMTANDWIESPKKIIDEASVAEQRC